MSTTFLHSYTVQRERDELIEANKSLRKRITDPKQEIQQWQQQFLTFCLNIGTSFLCLINYCRHQLFILHTSVVPKPRGRKKEWKLDGTVDRKIFSIKREPILSDFLSPMLRKSKKITQNGLSTPNGVLTAHTE